jgi:hypothetical protein
MYRGYIALWRKIEDHPFYKEPRVFSKYEAWIDILKEAQHNEDPQEVVFGMNVLICHYGECLKSNVTWAKKWRWSEHKVRRFLKLLEKMGQIRRENVGITSRITVINYESYDPRRRSSVDHPSSSRRGSVEGLSTDNNDNNEKNVLNTPLPPKGGNVSILKSYPYPEWLNMELWSDFHKMRTRIKKPITSKRTIDGLLKKLEDIIKSGYNQNEIIQKSIDHCWQSFYEPKGLKNAKGIIGRDGEIETTNIGIGGNSSKYDGIDQKIIDCQ